MTFAEKIKDLCKQKGISVHQLERDLGFGNGYIWTLKNKMPTDRAILISEYFGLPEDYFISETKKELRKSQNPLLNELMIKASNLSEAELTELLSFVGYIQSKH